MKEKQLNVLIPADLKKQIVVEAAKNGTSIKNIIALALSMYLDSEKK